MAAYSPGDPNTVYTSAGIRFDDNVLLLGADEDVPAMYGTTNRGDFVKSWMLGAQLQKQWSRQTFSLASQYELNRYGTYVDADYTAKNNSLGWSWALGDQLTGSLNANDQSELAGADTASLGEHDVIHDRGLQGTLRWVLNSRFALDGELGHTTEHQSVLTYYDYTQDAQGVSLVTTGNAGKWLSLKLENRKVTYAQDLSIYGFNDHYSLQYLTLNANWPLDEALLLTGRAGQVHIVTDQSNLDPNHGICELGAQWLLSGKTKLGLDLERDYDAPGRSLAPIVHDIVKLDLTWVLGAKTTLNGEWRDERRDYPSALIQGVEKTQTLQLSLQWTPYPSVQINPFVSHTVRTSMAQSDAYRDNQMGATIQINF